MSSGVTSSVVVSSYSMRVLATAARLQSKGTKRMAAMHATEWIKQSIAPAAVGLWR